VLGKERRKVAKRGVLAKIDPSKPPPAAAEVLPRPAGPGGAGAPAASGPYRVEGEIVAPVLSRRVNPEYPSEARIERVQGRVWVEATIDAAGNVTDLEILRGIAGLNVSSVDAVCCWKYKPATRN